MITENLSPKSVFYHFEKLCEIPHGSGNEKGVSDYCVDFAIKNGLWFNRDEANNVIIFKKGTKGYEDHEPVIIQGHLDMVCAVRAGVDIDMEKEPLKLKIYGDKLGAEDTSLGGDDGIAVAYALALLESDDIPHPPLEILLTTDEEVGMNGAAVVDLSTLKGKKLINVDSEEEGIFTVGCAGGLRVYSTLPVTREKCDGKYYKIVFDRLLGGHSGVEINRGRANSNVEAGKLLKLLSDAADLRILSLEGGDKDNVITPYTKAEILVKNADETALFDAFENYKRDFSDRFSGVEKNAKITLEEIEKTDLLPLDKASTDALINILFEAPFGVQKMNPFIEGLVQTSLNLGVLKLEESFCRIDHSVRSSVTAERDELGEKIKGICEKWGAESSFHNPYPAWEYREKSPLRDTMAKVWKEMTGNDPVVCTIHAGLECGLLGEKIDGLDAVSIGPDMSGIHSPEERLDIASVGRIWEFLKKTLAAL
ncbi:MAG: aminoacyl-histidine dipeptidase [Clostridia bacterium]|nr:aminoacyl-histidine dipeptidase [Clostridia bacterium]